MMNSKIKIYIGLALGVLLIAIIASLWSSHRMTKIETDAAKVKAAAERTETGAREIEQRAAEYKRKIEYLEGELSALRLIASEQNEQLKLIRNETNSARVDVDRARAVKRVASTSDELCAKLAELGHPCHDPER